MQQITDKIEGDCVVKADTELVGMITGSVTVKPGIHLTVRGMIGGKLTAEKGSTVEIHGTVVGMVVNNGAKVEIYGTVGSLHDTQSGTRTEIAAGAVIQDR